MLFSGEIHPSPYCRFTDLACLLSLIVYRAGFGPAPPWLGRGRDIAVLRMCLRSRHRGGESICFRSHHTPATVAFSPGNSGRLSNASSYSRLLDSRRVSRESSVDSHRRKKPSHFCLGCQGQSPSVLSGPCFPSGPAVSWGPFSCPINLGPFSGLSSRRGFAFRLSVPATPQT